MKKKLQVCSLFFVLIFGYQLPSFANVMYSKNLSGENIEIGNLLHWTTEQEENNQFFLVERSFDGIDFEKIGKTNGIGNSSETNEYEFLDVNVHTEKLFYRLQQVDFDGTFSYSEILQIQSTHPNNFMVNKMTNTMTTTTFEVILEVFKEGEIAYSLASLKGDQVVNEKLSAIVGFQKINVDFFNQKVAGLLKL